MGMCSLMGFMRFTYSPPRKIASENKELEKKEFETTIATPAE